MGSQITLLEIGKQEVQGQSMRDVPIIRVDRIVPVLKGNLQAFVTVTINRYLTIHNWRIVQQPGQKAWVSPPVREWVDADGKKRYAPLVELPLAVKGAVAQAILKEWQGHGR